MLCLCSSTTQKAKSNARDSASGEKAVVGAAGNYDKAQTEVGLGLKGPGTGGRSGGSVRGGTSRRRRLASCPSPSAAAVAAAASAAAPLGPSVALVLGMGLASVTVLSTVVGRCVQGDSSCWTTDAAGSAYPPSEQEQEQD